MWSPDRYSNYPTSEKAPERHQRGGGKEKRRQNKQDGRKSKSENEDWYRDVNWATDVEAEAEYDPLQTSKTFDSYTPPMEDYQVPWSTHSGQDDDGDETPGKGYYAKGNSVSRDSSAGAIFSPKTRRSEEAFRYLPSPASAEGDYLTNARRASSWGQGDKANYEIQSITSDLAAPTLGANEQPQIMWHESEGLYVMENGVLIPVSTSADDGETMGHGATDALGGAGPSTAKHCGSVRAGVGYGVTQGNIQRLTPILDGCSSSEPSDCGFGNSGPLQATRQQRLNYRCDADYEKVASSEEDEEDDDSDHGLTFAPGRKGIR